MVTYNKFRVFGGADLNKDMFFSEIIDYLKDNGKTSIGELYIRFHMMNKGNVYNDSDLKEITAQDIVAEIENMYKEGIVNYQYIDGEKLYYIV